MRAMSARLGALYFFMGGAIACFAGYFPIYLRGIGLHADEIGKVLAASPLFGVASTMAWAALADRLGTPTKALRFATIAALLPLLPLPFLVGAIPVALALVLHDASAPAIVPLADAVCADHVSRDDYARIRLFGTLGTIFVAQALGLLLASRGERLGDVLVPLCLIACVALYGVAAHSLPSSRARAAADRPGLADFGRLSRHPGLRFTLVMCLLHWITVAANELVFGLYLRDASLPSGLVGLAFVVGAISEALTLAVLPWLTRRLSASTIFALCFAATSLRWGALASVEKPAAILALATLHGFTVGVFLANGWRVINVVTPEGLRATGHALFAAVVLNLGNAIGFFLAGHGYHRLGGARPVLRIAALMELAPLLLSILLRRMMEEKEVRLS